MNQTDDNRSVRVSMYLLDLHRLHLLLDGVHFGSSSCESGSAAANNETSPTY